MANSICPCCRYLTMPYPHSFEICPVCGWQDDGQNDQDADEVKGGPNGLLSLSEARRNYLALGVVDMQSASNVRPPREDERP
jgi:hypothetical protein